MYLLDLDKSDKGRAIAAVVAIHAALLLALLHINGRDQRTGAPESVLRIIDFREVEPPPPPQRRQQQHRKRKEKEGGSSPANIKSAATPIVLPEPEIRLPAYNPVVVTQTPAQGAAPTQGASEVRGPGTGAGGSGTGAGAGSGSGSGVGAAATPAVLVRGITARDYPRGIMEEWPRGGAVYLRLRIEPSGRPSRCDVMRSFENPLVDQWTCSLVMQRGQFRPALDARGTPVAAWFGYKQVDVSDGM